MTFAILRQARTRRERGFGLVELIVAVAILGILLLVGLPIFGAIQKKARQNVLLSMAEQVAIDVRVAEQSGADPFAVVQYYNDQHRGNFAFTAAPFDYIGAGFGNIRITRTVGGIHNFWHSGREQSTPGNLYIYVMNDHDEWAGAGANRRDLNGWT